MISDTLNDKALIDKAIEFVEELFKNNSGGHGADHTLRVYRNAMFIAEWELPAVPSEGACKGACDKMIVALAALLHDADDYKLFDTSDNANARHFLRQNGVGEEMAERICTAINSVSFSKNQGRTPDSIEGMIVQDADRLDAIGAVGIARTFAFGGEHGRDMENSIQHFYDKLLRLKDLMNTKTGRELAEKRHEFMEIFLAEFERETAKY